MSRKHDHEDEPEFAGEEVVFEGELFEPTVGDLIDILRYREDQLNDAIRDLAVAGASVQPNVKFVGTIPTVGSEVTTNS